MRWKEHTPQDQPVSWCWPAERSEASGDQMQQRHLFELHSGPDRWRVSGPAQVAESVGIPSQGAAKPRMNGEPRAPGGAGSAQAR